MFFFFENLFKIKNDYDLKSIKNQFMEFQIPNNWDKNASFENFDDE